MKAVLRTYRQAPRKVRLVADLVRGKRVADALDRLAFLPKRAAEPLRKLIQSAVANAKQAGVEHPEDLVITRIQVDKGITYKRMEMRARGSANILHKHTSHIALSLGEKAVPTKK